MNIVSLIMAGFSLLGAVDLIIGNRIGIGKEFERGIMLMGTMALSMVGMLVLAPLISHLLSPVLGFIAEKTPFDPSIIAGSLLANDMGGASLSQEFAKTPAAGYFNGLVVAAMMGATLSFSLPIALGTTKKEQHESILLGLMCGISTVPVGCFIAGLICKMPIGELIIDLVPLIVLSALLAIGLFKIPGICVKIFGVFGILVKTLVIAGLAIGIFEFLTGYDIVPYTDSVENGIKIVFNASAVMTGAFPLLFLLGKLIGKPLRIIGKKIGINETSALGFVSSLATNVTTFSMMKDMDEKGVVLNSAFAVSAAFTFAGHLAFTLSYNADYLPAVICGKLLAGASAVIMAVIIYSRKEKRRLSV
ncbi:MAG: ethanolamine utilization protein EutH [Eubacteriales bacterium]